MANKKKIVQIIKTLEIGGCEGALLRMLPRIKDTLEHTIITLQKSGSLAPLFEEQGIKVIALDQKNLLDLSSYPRLRRILADAKPDLVVTNLLHADIIGRFFIQFVVPCRVVSSLVTTYNFDIYWPARFFERSSKFLADGYMANAESVKKAYIENFGVKPDKITVLPRGIDTELFSGIEPNETLRSTLGIKTDDSVAICVANLHPNKGHRFLLEAFEKLYETRKNIRLLLVGEGQEKKNLLRQCENYGSKANILFLGKRNDVPQLLRLSHVFVLPTFFEGMSNAIMEAMASRLPTITTNIPENQELITHKEHGLLCPVGNSDCLAESLRILFANEELAKSLGIKAQQKMQEKYNFEKTANDWNNFFLQMAQ